MLPKFWNADNFHEIAGLTILQCLPCENEDGHQNTVECQQSAKSDLKYILSQGLG